ncbi:hypothetical protein J6590_017477 [Homalodisca vitripennis]|nr:hypothetical protein J6590_017477 [Homalodisca vitripennis]
MTGSVRNRPKSGRIQSATDEEHALDVLQTFIEDPHTSLRKAAQQHDMHPMSVTTKYWRELSVGVLQEKLTITKKKGVAKNLILFLGDGMSLATLAAARIYLGQLKKEAGENTFLSFEKFPYTGLAKTYCADSQVADSACSATAYLTGVKGNIYTVGVTSSVGYMDWRNMKNESYHTTSILKWAQDAGKGTGIVSTCRITDASPAGTYAHSAYRYKHY